MLGFSECQWMILCHVCEYSCLNKRNHEKMIVDYCKVTKQKSQRPAIPRLFMSSRV